MSLSQAGIAGVEEGCEVSLQTEPVSHVNSNRSENLPDLLFALRFSLLVKCFSTNSSRKAQGVPRRESKDHSQGVTAAEKGTAGSHQLSSSLEQQQHPVPGVCVSASPRAFGSGAHPLRPQLLPVLAVSRLPLVRGEPWLPGAADRLLPAVGCSPGASPQCLPAGPTLHPRHLPAAPALLQPGPGHQLAQPSRPAQPVELQLLSPSAVPSDPQPSFGPGHQTLQLSHGGVAVPPPVPPAQPCLLLPSLCPPARGPAVLPLPQHGLLGIPAAPGPARGLLQEGQEL